MDKKQADKKKSYALAWEYLKRSESYLEYCKLKNNSRLPIPDKFQTANIPIQDINPIAWTYEKCGNVHKQSFEKWFKVYCSGWGKTNFGKVDDLSGIDPSMKYFMRNTFIFIIDIFKGKNGREPSLLEMAELLPSLMRHEKEFQSYLKIKQAEFTMAEVDRLTKEVRDILKKKIPDVRQRRDELQRYLEVYDIWKSKKGKKGKNWISVVLETIPFYKRNSNDDIERMIKRDLAKAKEQIKQAEKGLFLQ